MNNTTKVTWFNSSGVSAAKEGCRVPKQKQRQSVQMLESGYWWLRFVCAVFELAEWHFVPPVTLSSLSNRRSWANILTEFIENHRTVLNYCLSNCNLWMKKFIESRASDTLCQFCNAAIFPAWRLSTCSLECPRSCPLSWPILMHSMHTRQQLQMPSAPVTALRPAISG